MNTLINNENVLSILGTVKNMISSQELLSKYRLKSSYFTRDRKLPFPHTLLFLFNFVRKSLAIEIDNYAHYMKEIGGKNIDCNVTKSAFVQNRMKFHPDVFKELTNAVTSKFYELESKYIELFKGLRVLGIDGSMFTLPNLESLAEDFGISKNQSDVRIVQARISVLYDLLNSVVIDSTISHQKFDERMLAVEHLDKCTDTDLLIYDRGYNGFDFMNLHFERNLHFVMRMKTSKNIYIKKFIESGKKSEIIEIKHTSKKPAKYSACRKGSVLKIRLIRVELTKGEVEVLATS